MGIIITAGQFYIKTCSSKQKNKKTQPGKGARRESFFQDGTEQEFLYDGTGSKSTLASPSKGEATNKKCCDSYTVHSISDVNTLKFELICFQVQCCCTAEITMSSDVQIFMDLTA